MGGKIGLFIIALVVPFVYWRVLFYLAPHVFNKIALRTKTGLQIHHLHYGVVLIFIASLLLLLGGESAYMVVLLGLGLGLVLDEFIASLLMPGDRPLELEVYGKSLFPTAALFSFIVLLTALWCLVTDSF
ncbi:hypothetical protein COU12_01965 [Candidatus Jorgensenbacteria bacterium CG10_big_fil_rev_8_21_14_0_10_54_38]|uniref:Uncharacterized protein n=2 Tax=Candidatus Joergenseniibacteriota TaxID=1752739 RepID=A0A2M6WFT1_9BACT|nr:MAG: hypothetical protein COX26_00270 [Candidatus Jorgensenbacteria bacterium CG23_combo_of_CG06-09_8_20_14_all_54_14]PIT91651.1 MAG: hypothetical protein COU12_01965 [Candidatus Jorgensenbacteria bacterium CG10_big_fil_rev_8_21_14_0_10_54_38]